MANNQISNMLTEGFSTGINTKELAQWAHSKACLSQTCPKLEDPRTAKMHELLCEVCKSLTEADQRYMRILLDKLVTEPEYLTLAQFWKFLAQNWEKLDEVLRTEVAQLMVDMEEWRDYESYRAELAEMLVANI